jgi:acyl-CoA thioesterase FadM
MVEKYRKERRVASFDSDYKARLKPASFLNWAQEAANVHADYLGVGYDTITTTRKAWVLARTHVIFHRLPAWREVVTLLSWHKRANGFQYYRDFMLESAEGERLVSATTTWLVIDIDTRKLVRNNDFGDEGILGINEDVIEEPTFRTEEDSITRFDNQNRRRRNRNRRDKDSRHKDRDRQPKAVAEGEQAHEEGREEGRQRQERRRDRQRNNRQDAGSENRTQQQGDTPQNDTPKGEGQRRDRRRNNRSRNRGENQQEGRQEGKQDSRQDNREGGRNERRQEEHRTRQESRSEHKEPKQE